MLRKSYGVLALAVILTPALAVGWAPAELAPESRIWVTGGSSVRSYECKATRIDGTIVMQPAAKVADLSQAVKRVEIGVPVALMECGNGTMNGHMRKALKVNENPMIRYRLASHQVSAKGDNAGTVRMNGTLSIAGQEKPVSIDATLSRTAAGEVRVQGSKEIRMTEFGVKPPSLMMGTMKVHDPVTVHFDVVMKP